MNNKQIDEFARSNKFTKKGYYGCLPFNAIPQRKVEIFPTFFVLNTCTLEQVDTLLDPCHWYVLHVSRHRVELFNSAGGHEFRNLNPILRFLEIQQKPVYYNSVQIQSFDSSACGIFCLMFIYATSVKISFKKFIRFFDFKNLRNNDQIVSLLFKSAYLEA